MKFKNVALVALCVAIIALAVAADALSGAPSPEPLLTFVTGATVCNVTRTTGAVMGGMGATWQYTPKQTGRLLITFNFDVWHPAGDHDLNYTLAYGTVAGGVPACDAPATGTPYGDTFSTSSSKVPGPTGDIFVHQSETVAVTLTPGTAYWFDMQAYIENLATTHQLLHPQMTVLEA